jgi:peptidoglycan hydrolase CwlO-like protein
MRIDVYHHFGDNGAVERKLDNVLALLQTLVTQGVTMSKELDDLTAQVAANTNLEQSAVTMIQGLAAQIAAAKNDPAAIQALSDQLNTSATALTNAITANTPAATSASRGGQSGQRP